MNDLIVSQVNKAAILLQQARDATDCKQVADMAKAAEVYAKRQKLSEDVIASATAIRVDAMTMMGKFLKTMEKNVGGRPKTGSPKEPVLVSPTYTDLGIGKKEASQAQALAEVQVKQPELHEEIRTGKRKVVQAVREVQKEAKRKDLKEKAAEAKLSGEAREFSILQGDCIERLAKLPNNSARLIFADPPYNEAVDYGEGKKADQLPEDEYLARCRMWMEQCYNLLTRDGSMWVLISQEYADHFGILLRQIGLHRRAWITWYETFGVNRANNFNRCSRTLHYFVKDPKRFVFNADAVNRLSDRQTKYNDKRADPGGKIWDDVWQIPRLVGTSKERIPGFPNQLPLDLLRPIVGCASDPGDLVVDPFCGTGTTGAACIELGRRFVGIEKTWKNCDQAILRLKGHTWVTQESFEGEKGRPAQS